MEDLLMGVKDAQRLGPLKAAIEGRITNAKGAELTGMSLRQFKRLRRRVREQGAAGLLHGNRGRTSPRRLSAESREQVVALLQLSEARLNDCHVRDVLSERGLEVSAETVRTIRRELGLAPKRRRRPARHRTRRLREAREGSLVLIDGTEFAWLGEHHPPFTLVGTLDDATGAPLALVRRPHEDLHGFTQAVRDTIVGFGLPEAFYGDRTAIAVRNDLHWSREEELLGHRHPTQFGRMLVELDVRYLAARSPEAKGRIERHWQMVQDRLPAELARRGIRTIEGFDAFLPEFVRLCRGWFAVAPRETVSAWRKAPRHLDRILACCYERVVGRDNVVTFPGGALQIPPGPHQRSYARARVEVRELLDGRLLVLCDGRLLLEQPAPTGAFTLVPRESARKRRPARTVIDLRRSLRAEQSRPTPARPTSPVGNHTALGHSKSRPTSQHPWKKRTFKPQLPPLTAVEG
jgi:transposase